MYTPYCITKHIEEAERDRQLMHKLFAVCSSVNSDKQLLACRKYVDLTKKQLKVPFSFTYAEKAYREARDRVFSFSDKLLKFKTKSISPTRG